MTLSQSNEENDNTNNENINWDGLLNEIQAELGPITAETTSLQSTDTSLPEKTANGTCIWCLKCENVKLWYPQFPTDAYHIALVHWLRMIVAPTMQHYRRCFVCVMMYIMSNPTEFNLIDQVLAEKLIHSIPDLMAMPHLCIHENRIEPDTSEMKALPESPETKETPPTKQTPKDIRQIINDFNENKNTEENNA